MRLKLLVPAIAVAALAWPLATMAAPPSDARPLSEILAQLEGSADVAWIEEVEWDDDGYWEVEYHTTDGSKVEVKIDPVTGDPRG